MKKFSLVLLALALALAVTPVASASPAATPFYFTFTGDGVFGSGNLYGTQVSPGVYNITSGSGTFSDGLASAPVTITLVANPAFPNNSSSPSGKFVYDNMVSPGAPVGLILDSKGGLLFLESSNSLGNQELNIWAGTANTNWQAVAGTNNDSWSEYGSSGYLPASNGWGAPGTFRVPEPSMAFLLIPALGFVGVIRKKFMV